jgi:hypothetical protein
LSTYLLDMGTTRRGVASVKTAITYLDSVGRPDAMVGQTLRRLSLMINGKPSPIESAKVSNSCPDVKYRYDTVSDRYHPSTAQVHLLTKLKS